MVALWFYKNTSVFGRIMAPIRGCWADVGIAHTVTDVSVVTAANPLRGVWCAPQSRARRPDDVVYLDIPDDFTTKWLVYRWGVRYHWFDLLVPASVKPIERAPTSVELARQLIIDADKAGHRTRNLDITTILFPMRATALHAAVAVPV